MKQDPRISYKIKWAQSDIFITTKVTLVTLFPAAATSLYLSIFILLFAGGAGSPAKRCNSAKTKFSDEQSHPAGGRAH